MNKMTVEEFISNINKGFLNNNERTEISKRIAESKNISFQIRCLKEIEFLPGESEVVNVLKNKQPDDFSTAKEYEHFLREMVQVDNIRLKGWFDKILSLEECDISTLTLALRRAYGTIKNSPYTGKEYVKAIFDKILEKDIKSKTMKEIIEIIDEHKEKFTDYDCDVDYIHKFLDLVYDNLKTGQIDGDLLKTVYWAVDKEFFDNYEILLMILKNNSATTFLRFHTFKKLISINPLSDYSSYAGGLLLYTTEGSTEEKFLKDYIMRFKDSKKYYIEGRERLIPQINQFFEEINNEQKPVEMTPPLFRNSIFNRTCNYEATLTDEGKTV